MRLFLSFLFLFSAGSTGDNRATEANMWPMGDMDGLNSAPGHSFADGVPRNEPLTYPQGLQMCALPCTQYRPCVANSHILLEVTLLELNMADMK
jgi:hypothetical protein